MDISHLINITQPGEAILPNVFPKTDSAPSQNPLYQHSHSRSRHSHSWSPAKLEEGIEMA
jgi:hypothetical protein